MKYVSTSLKLKLLVIYLYIAPLILSDLLIFNSNRLLGDFSGVEIDFDMIEILSLNLLYLTPLLIIYLFLKICGIGSSDEVISDYQERNYINFYSLLIIINSLITYFFGAIPVGEAGSAGIVGGIQAFNAKLNPYIILIFLSALNIKNYKFFVCCILVAITSLMQKSLLGYFVLFIATYILVLSRYNINFIKLILLLLAPIVLCLQMGEVFYFIYDLRNKSRGFYQHIDYELIFSYALGRINSLSSFYTIYNGKCCSEGVSNFYVIGEILKRLTSLSFVETINPTYLFNSYLLGNVNSDYSIFTSTAGALFILMENGYIISLINIFSILLSIILMYFLMPFPKCNNKIYIFLISFYFVYLSGDIWEFSILLQSFIFIKILQFTYFNFKVRLTSL